MTPECALTKLSYLLAKKDLSRGEVRKLMGRSLRGELTERQADFTSEQDRDDSGGHVRRLLKQVLIQEGHPTFSVDEDMDSMAIAAEKALLPCM